MKISNLFHTLTVLAAATGFVSCDNIAEDDRFIPVERPTIHRKVLIQEFSGIRCSNCPDGARLIESLQATYPGSFVAVSLQPEGLNLTSPIRGFSLATREARDYYDYYNVAALPTAIFDGGTPFPDSRTWTEPAIAALSVESEASLEIKSSFDESTRMMKAEYEVAFNKIYTGNVSILFWITESGIVGKQIDGTTTLSDYVHNHVFRATANGLWGDNIGSSFLPDDKVSGEVEFAINSDWKAENCHVVAFIFDSNSKAVIQSEQVELIDHNK